MNNKSLSVCMVLLTTLMLLSCGAQDASTDAAAPIKDPFKEALDAQNSTQNTAQNTSPNGDAGSGLATPSQVFTQSSGSAAVVQHNSSSANRSLGNANANSNAITPTPGQDPFKAFLEAHPPAATPAR